LAAAGEDASSSSVAGLRLIQTATRRRAAFPHEGYQRRKGTDIAVADRRAPSPRGGPADSEGHFRIVSDVDGKARGVDRTRTSAGGTVGSKVSPGTKQSWS